jgi:release factor glutamine methyltransferase
MATGSEMKTWTVLELLKWTTDYFERAGIENPRLNAEVLLSEVLGMERIMLYARFEEPVGPENRATFRELVKKRAERIPLQHLTGSWEFRGREFKVSPDVLVPRQETEFLVDRCMDLLPEGCDGWAADVGTGSGIIAVTLACEHPKLHLAAVDRSEAALDVARQNAERHGVAERVELLHGDLLEPLPDVLPGSEPGWHLVASNPPYIPTGEIDDLEPEVREHEPRLALDGGASGLEVVQRLVRGAAPLLAPAGWLVLELAPGQAPRVRELAREAGHYDVDTVHVMEGPGGHQRIFSVARREGT